VPDFFKNYRYEKKKGRGKMSIFFPDVNFFYKYCLPPEIF
jgi:hypothetical protein